MAVPVDIANVRIWDMLVGAVYWDQDRGFATFEFDPEFLKQGLDLAPRLMPLAESVQGSAMYSFPALPRQTFYGLPGLLADALPDRFGNSIINSWLARQGRAPEDFSPVERLCYTGKRAMGALEFEPPMHPDMDESVPVEISELVGLAQEVADRRKQLHADIEKRPADALMDIIRVGTSAGGMRPKAVIALNEITSEIRSGQVTAPDGFDYWILKFDGVKDEALGDPQGYGRVEYAYHNMARDAGITMTDCKLLEEGGRAHFLTRRFDRTASAGKLHMQSLCAIAHFDYNSAGAYSYEQAFQTIRRLQLPYGDTEQQFRRMVFNVVARNLDDHTKNIAFLMDHQGNWRLSPAFDVIFAHNPGGTWTNRHQMTINGKTDDFTSADLIEVGDEMGIKSSKRIVAEIVDVVARWPGYAESVDVPPSRITEIGKAHRLS